MEYAHILGLVVLLSLIALNLLVLDAKRFKIPMFIVFIFYNVVLYLFFYIGVL